jgi:peptide/nickel transport system substrate-binding protein
MVRTLREAAEGLRRIGVTVELHEVSDGEYLEGLRNKEFSMAAMEIELSFWPDLAAVLKTGGELNYSYYTNSLVDAYIEQAEAQEDPEVVVAAYNEIEKLLLEDNPIIGMYVIQNAAIVRNELRGVRRELLFPQDILGSAGEWWIKRAPN